MKQLPFFIVGLAWLIGQSIFLSHQACAQATPANGSSPPVPDENFEEEFESIAFEELKLDPDGDRLPKVVGQNQNGQIEYSVLDNRVRIASPKIQPEPLRSNTDATPDERTISASTELNHWLTSLILKNMPHEYSKEKNWGNQTKRWAGIRLRRDDDDGKLETKRRYKQVNHGMWRKYAARLADPDKKFAVQLGDFSNTKDHKTAFDVSFAANLLLDARQSKWVKGVQLYSFSAQGTATVRLSVDCELGIDMDFSQFPPDLILNPSITDATIRVDDFKLDRISKAGGEIAQQMTRLARKELDNDVEKHERKLVKKLNEEIDENRDKLRISIADAVKLKWFDKAKDFIPREVRGAVSANKSHQNKRSNPK